MHNLEYKTKNYMHRILILPITFLIFTLAGCATAPYTPSSSATMGMPGIYHRVEKGQTLWRISKMYDTDLDEIVRINRIPESSTIEIGQLIFIPNRKKPQYQEYKASNTSDDFNWPIKGKIITRFGQTYKSMVNKGVNIQPFANTDVIAVRSGKVVFCINNFNGYGKTIIINHGDGFMSVYAGNSSILVTPGESVQKGSSIARINTDSKSYLHFEIRKGNIAQNPYFYL